MLDLGFLEDVEKILYADAEQPPDGAVQRDDAAADPQARRPLPLRPGDDQGQGREPDRRLRRAVPARGRDRRTRPTSSSRCCAAERPDQAIVFVRTKIRTRPALPHAARQGHERARAARRHVPGLARRRDARLQGRPRADPRGHRRRRPRPGHLDRHARHQLRRPDARPDVYVHRIGRTGRVGRSGRAITFVEPRQKRELEAIEQPHRHLDRAVEPRARRRRRRRVARAPAPPHQAARLSRDGDEPYTKLVAGAGRAGRAWRSPTSSTPSPTRAGLDGEAVRDVRVLERFSLFAVPDGRGRARSSTPWPGRRSTARPLRLQPLRPSRCPVEAPRALCRPWGTA